MNWVSGHRSGVVRWIIVAVVVVLAVATAMIYWGWNSSKADVALDAALDTYTAPLLPPGAPPMSGTYATTGDRAKAANLQFVAPPRGMDGCRRAPRLTTLPRHPYRDASGNSASAETELKAAANSWVANLANLAKLALAGLDHKMHR